jgi:hypothetical protein
MIIKHQYDACYPLFLCCNDVAYSGNTIVVTVKIKHTCIGMPSPSHLPTSSLTLLLHPTPEALNKSWATTTRSIIDAVCIHSWQHIHIWEAQRDKAPNLHDTFSQHCKQLFILFSYLEQPSNSNKKVYHFLQVNVKNLSVRRIFVHPELSRSSFTMSYLILTLY